MRKTLVAMLAASLFASTANAQEMICGKRDTFLQRLKEGYSEAPVSMGLASNGSVIEVLASSKGTFTIIMTRPNGVTCLMAVGENWERIKRNEEDVFGPSY